MYIFVPMSAEHAEEIAYSWKYDEPYSFYNLTEDEDDLKDFLNTETWKDRVYAVLDDKKQLVGFFRYILQNSELVIKHGLKPELTGKGFGKKFVQSGLTFGISKFKNIADSIILTVESINKGAINIYEQLGFVIVKQEIIYTKNNDYEFFTMKRNMHLDESHKEDERFMEMWERKRRKGKAFYLIIEILFTILLFLFGTLIILLLLGIYAKLFNDVEFLSFINILKEVFQNSTLITFLPYIATLLGNIIGSFINWSKNEKRYNELINTNSNLQ